MVPALHPPTVIIPPLSDRTASSRAMVLVTPRRHGRVPSRPQCLLLSEECGCGAVVVRKERTAPTFLGGPRTPGRPFPLKPFRHHLRLTIPLQAVGKESLSCRPFCAFPTRLFDRRMKSSLDSLIFARPASLQPSGPVAWCNVLSWRERG